MHDFSIFRTKFDGKRGNVTLLASLFRYCVYLHEMPILFELLEYQLHEHKLSVG